MLFSDAPHASHNSSVECGGRHLAEQGDARTASWPSVRGQLGSMGVLWDAHCLLMRPNGHVHRVLRASKVSHKGAGFRSGAPDLAA